MPDLLKYNFLGAYLLASLRKTGLWGTFSRTFKYARRFIFFTRIFKYIRITAAIIEASTVLLLFTAIILAIAPFFIIAASVIVAAELIVGARILRSEALHRLLSRERIYIIASAGDFGKNFAKSLVPDAAVFVVSAEWERGFVAMRECGGVYYIRHTFFFRLKRKMLAKHSDKTVYLL